MGGLGKRYQVLGQLGPHQLFERSLGRHFTKGSQSEVVLDRLRPELSTTPWRAAIEQEARLLAGVRQPGVEAIVAVEQDSADLLIVREVLSGVSLRRLDSALEARKERIPVPIALSIVSDVLETLEGSLGPHGGVTADGIYVGYDGRTRLVSPLVTRARSLLGEQGMSEGGAPIDTAKDVQALAAVLHELVPSFDCSRSFTEAAELRRAMYPSLGERSPREVVGRLVRGVFFELYELEMNARERSDYQLLARVTRDRTELEPKIAFESTRTERVDATLPTPLPDPHAAREPEPPTAVRTSDAVLIKLSGSIDEYFHCDNILALAKDANVVILDLDGVNRVTSYGVREWISTLEAIRAPYYGFVRARQMVVAQFNMVSSFCGRGELISMYAPYLCLDCGKPTDVVVDLRTDRHMLHSSSYVPNIACPACGGPSEFDDLPEAYFAHAASRPPPNPPAAARELLDTGAAVTKERLQVQKDVEGSVTAVWMSGALDDRARFKYLADGLEGVVLIEASKVSSISPTGVRRLVEFLLSASINVQLARVKPDLALALAGSQRTPAGRVISASIEFGCPSCGWAGVLDTEAPFEWLSERTPREQLCHECFEGLIEPKVDDALRMALSRLGASHVPDAASVYLASHRESPATRKAAPSSPAPSSLPEDVPLFGKYQLLGRLGAGGMAEVYLARQIGMAGFEKRVAVKRILPNLAARKEFIEMFLEEARIAARLSHPNIVQIFDLGRHKQDFFIVMEHVNGWDLSKIMLMCRRIGLALPVDVTCRIVSDICAGLSAAHTHVDNAGKVEPIIHRDVSPQNVLVSNRGVVKLTDFGIADVGRDAGTPGRTGETEVLGKFAYMAPERLDRGRRIDARSDIFSVGVVLFEMLTLKRLFSRENPLLTMNAVRHDPVPPISDVRTDVPQAVEAIVARALARKVEDRYATADEMHLALETFLASLGAPVAATRIASFLRAIAAREASGSRT